MFHQSNPWGGEQIIMCRAQLNVGQKIDPTLLLKYKHTLNHIGHKN
jgi:hypothetical protein